jgi:hypothetical protein
MAARSHTAAAMERESEQQKEKMVNPLLEERQEESRYSASMGRQEALSYQRKRCLWG